MRHRILGLLGGRRRRSLLGGTVAIAAAGVFAISALAVHDLKFQLDGDVSASTTTNVGGTTQTVDWDTLFDASGNKKPLPAGFTASAFQSDFSTNANGSFNTSDNTTYATGSKDTLAITPGWQCNTDNNVLSKNDIMNAYATAFTDTGGDQVIYFALERNANTGDGNVAFWFLQDDTVGCVSGGGATAFTGDHRDGDLLIVSAFTNGGSVSNIDVYRWNGGANGSLGTTAVAHGVDCKSTAGADSACATVNGPTNGVGGTITTPWLTANKQDGVGHSLRTSEFFEGGLNLTKSNLGGKCFNEFIADTRSSQSLTATLFDFARGSIGECQSTIVTTPVDNAGIPIPAGGLTIPTDPADAALLVKDKADIAVTGASSFNATVTFHLCGPLAAGSTTTCDSGGVQIGSPQAVTANGTFTSAAATVTAAGRYCWRGDFSGDAAIGVPAKSDSSAAECFKVNPVTPTLTTQAGAGPVPFGQPVTDTATLTGTAHKPGTGGPAGSTDGSINPATLGGDATGTITFTLYKDSSCSVLATGTGTNPQTQSVSGDGTYGPVSFTPDAPGTYHWVASYGGDSPNTNASSPSACLDENEDVVVEQIPTNIKTRQSWYPNDTANVSAASGNLGGGGSVAFSLYDNATCSGTALYTETKSITGGSPSETVSTNNITFQITTGYDDPAASTAGPYSWKVVYTPAAGDTAHTGKQSSCDAEHFAITYTNDPGPGSNLP
jgi:hypothetical protein